MARLERFMVFCICFTVLFPPIAFARPLTTVDHAFSISRASNVLSRSTTCGFPGNPDVYGPGIRVGIYAQTLAVFLTKYFILGQAHVLRDSLTVFSIAILVVAIIYAANANSIYAVEFFIVLQILSWNCLTGVRARNSYSNLVMRNRGIRVISMEVMNMAALSLHAWFWFRGIDEMVKGSCGSKVFFFIETSLDGWFREMMKVMAVLGLVDHVWDFAWRWLSFLGRGRQNNKEEDIQEAIVQFENWKKSRETGRQEGGEAEKVSLDQNDATHPIFRALSRATTEETVPTSGTTTPISATLTTDSTREDEESISVKVPRIRTQLLVSSSELSPQLRDPTLQTTTEATTSREADIPLFEELSKAEQFLNHCIAASSSSQLRIRHPRLYKNFLRTCLIPRPLKYDVDVLQSSPSPYTYHECLRVVIKAFATFTYSKQASLLVTHLISSRTLDFYNGVYQVHAAITYSADLPSPRSISLASRIKLSQSPPRPSKVRWMHALLDFIIHVFMMLQIELTIKWNRISGLMGVGNMGQLIPLLVGVGGLGLVTARGVEGLCRGEKTWEVNDEYDGDWRVGGLRGFVETYERWKLMREEELEKNATVVSRVPSG